MALPTLLLRFLSDFLSDFLTESGAGDGAGEGVVSPAIIDRRALSDEARCLSTRGVRPPDGSADSGMEGAEAASRRAAAAAAAAATAAAADFFRPKAENKCFF